MEKQMKKNETTNVEGKRTVKENTQISIIVLSLITLVIGIIQVYSPDFVISVLDYIVGTGILVVGLFYILLYLRSRHQGIYSNNLALGIMLTMIGLYFLIHQGFALGIIALVFGLYIVANGVFGIQFSLDAKQKGFHKWIILLVFSIINILLGVAVLFFPFATSQILIFYSGIIMIVSALINIVVLFVSKWVTGEK